MKPELVRLVQGGVFVHAAAGATDGSDPTPTLSGRIATYGKVVHPNGPWHAVRLADGALSAPDPASRVKLLYGHDNSRVIGSMGEWGVADGTPDVDAQFRLANTDAAREAASLAADGHVDGLSVGYLVRDGQMVIEDGVEIFEVTAADLYEVSLLPFPADVNARVSAVTQTERNPAVPTPSEPQDRGIVDIGTEPGTALVTAEQITAAVQAAFAHMAPPAAAPSIPPHLTAQVRPEPKVNADGYGRFLPAYVAANGLRITAGDYISALMRHRDGDSDAWGRIQAALATDTTTQVPGLLPVQIVQPVIDTLSPVRPVFESMTDRPMPAFGAKFQRPTITQHVAVGQQTAELAEVASQAMTVGLSDVAKRTIAGALKLSVQSIDWTTPALLDLVIADFANVYAKWTEQDISTLFAAAATGTAIPIGTAPTPEDLNAALYEATANSWLAGGIIPNRVWMSLDVWAMVGSMVDADGRPVYPFFGQAVNAWGSLSPSSLLSNDGQSVGGVPPVVGPYLPTGTLIVGPSAYTEVYEDRRGMLRVADPATLGQVLGWYGYIANYVAVPTSFIPIEFEAAP